MGVLAALLSQLQQRQQGQGAPGGFGQPGNGMPASGAPTIPMMQGGASNVQAPAMPSAFNGSGQMNQQPGGGGMSPMLMQMLAKLQGGGQSGGQPAPAGASPVGGVTPFFAGQGSYDQGGNALPSQLPWQNQPSAQSGGLQALLARLFAGGGSGG